MRSLKTLVFCFLTLTAGCCDDETLAKGRESLGEGVPHELHSLGEYEGLEVGVQQTTFFIFYSSTSVEASTQFAVKFAWRLSDQTYAINTLPIERVRVRIDNAIETPTIEFQLLEASHDQCSGSPPEDDLQYLIDNLVTYATITCRDSDWPADIQVPPASP